jgi:transposase
MRFVGIDVAAERHVVAVVDETDRILLKATPFTEDAEGYAKLLGLLGAPSDALVAMEATGHYWKNLFAALVAAGFAVALLNPLRTRRFAGEDLQRTQTDAIDALGIARFAAQKRPAASRLPDGASEELRELVRFRDRLRQDFGDRVRQLHRLVDLGFPEFTRHVRELGSELATALLHAYSTAAGFQGVPMRRVAALRYDGRHKVGNELAGALIAAAAGSVGRHHGEVYRVQVRNTCEDLEVLRRRLRELEGDIERLLERHEIGRLLTTIDGIGPQTAARLVATFGDFSSFRGAGALASYVGAVPALKAIGEADLPAREPHADRGGPLAGQALDAGAHRGPDESVAACLLRTADRAGQVAQGCAGGRDAEVAARRLQRGHASSSVRGQSRHGGGPPMKKSLDGRHGIS